LKNENSIIMKQSWDHTALAIVYNP